MTVLQMALLATTGTWLLTALGAALVVFFKKPQDALLNILLGFAAGVMVAASFWSLLQPAVERAELMGGAPAYLVATTGFLCGALFVWGTSKLMDRSQRKQNVHSALSPTTGHRRVLMLMISITLHNVAEGMAVGVAFGALASGYTTEGLMGAITVAVGIGLQNFPEGAAVSLPLRREGCSRFKSFMLGQASGMVEPIGGVLGALMVVKIEAALPFMLTFAAGTMVLVAVHDLIPECQGMCKNNPYRGSMGIIFGFSVMMLMDIMLG